MYIYVYMEEKVCNSLVNEIIIILFLCIYINKT